MNDLALGLFGLSSLAHVSLSTSYISSSIHHPIILLSYLLSSYLLFGSSFLKVFFDVPSPFSYLLSAHLPTSTQSTSSSSFRQLPPIRSYPLTTFHTTHKNSRPPTRHHGCTTSSLLLHVERIVCVARVPSRRSGPKERSRSTHQRTYKCNIQPNHPSSFSVAASS